MSNYGYQVGISYKKEYFIICIKYPKNNFDNTKNCYKTPLIYICY